MSSVIFVYLHWIIKGQPKVSEYINISPMKSPIFVKNLSQYASLFWTTSKRFTDMASDTGSCYANMFGKEVDGKHWFI